MKIYALKSGSLNELERLEIARLLIKAGYTVRLGKEKANGKSSLYIHYVEYLDGEE